MVQKPPRFFGEKPEVEIEFGNAEAIESAVATALAVSDGVDATSLTVTAKGHEISLMGSVMSPAEVERAVEVAQSVPGVQKVRTNIQVGPQGQG